MNFTSVTACIAIPKPLAILFHFEPRKQKHQQPLRLYGKPVPTCIMKLLVPDLHTNKIALIYNMAGTH